MAIEKDNLGNDQFQNQQQQQGPAVDPTAFAPIGDQNDSLSLLNLFSLMNSVSATDGDAYLLAAVDVYSKAIAGNNEEFRNRLSRIMPGSQAGELKLHVIDRNDPQFAGANGVRRSFSALVLALPVVKGNGGKTVIWNTLLLEATGEPLGPMKHRFNAAGDGSYQEFELDQVTTQALKGDLESVARELIETQYKGFSTRNLGGFVIPRNAQPKVNNEQKPDEIFLRLIAAAINQTRIEQMTVMGIKGVNLAEMVKGMQLSADVRPRQPSAPHMDLNGNPVRSDFSVYSYLKPTARQDLKVGAQVAQTTPLSTVHMYLDLSYTRNDRQLMMTRDMNRQIVPPFTPTLVLSDIELPIGSLSPSSVVLGLASALLAARNYSYLAPLYSQEFVPSGLKDVNLRDIGALNIEGNFQGVPGQNGAFIPTDPAKMSNEERQQFLGAMVNTDALAVAVDVPVGQPLSPIMDFLAAMRTDGDARLMFVAIADTLFNGAFTRNLLKAAGREPSADNLISTVRGIPLTLPSSETLIGGYYTDQTQQRRDLRTLDYLAAANYFRNNPTSIRAFAETFAPGSGSQELRQFVRLKYIKQMAGNYCAFTHQIERVTLSPILIRALSDTLAETNFLQVNASGESVLADRHINSDLAVATVNPANLSVSRPAPSYVSQGGYTHTAYRY